MKMPIPTEVKVMVEIAQEQMTEMNNKLDKVITLLSELIEIEKSKK